MKTQTLKISSMVVLLALILSACSELPVNLNLKSGSPVSLPGVQVDNSSQAQASSSAQPAAPALSSSENSLLAAYQGTLEAIYTQVNPSVINISVVKKESTSQIDMGQFNLPFQFPGSPQDSQPQSPQYSQGMGSGFIWDKEGHIVTNNHVVDGADKIEVTFTDGTTLPAELVGADAHSDLAVVKVDAAPDLLHPVTLADSDQVKIGQLVVVIGNPFGLAGTMTVGIISALDRSLPASESSQVGPAFSIPDIIQTDAPINPGNSGGVLLNDQGQVIGVTAAIESPVRANAGVGFAIPSAIVQRVVPALVKGGTYEHPYLGISGTTLTLDLAKVMNLKDGIRGVLVVTVAPKGPAEKAGLQGSDKSVTIDGQNIQVGGDVVIAINGHPITTMDELIAYLADETTIGQKVNLTLLRDGKEISLDVILAARPAQVAISQPSQDPDKSDQGNSGGAYLGILGAELTPEVAKAVGIDENQQGILIQQVESGSPADQANLHGSYRQITVNGKNILVGGDIIASVDGQSVTTLAGLRSILQQLQPGQEATLTILRDGRSLDVQVKLGARPGRLP